MTKPVPPTDAAAPAASAAPPANWSENFVQDHYKPHSYTTHDKQHHAHKHFGTTNADVDKAAADAAKGVKADLKSGVTPSEDRDHFFTAKAGKDLGSLEEQARGGHTAAERAFASKVLARTKAMLSQDKELQSLGFNKGDTILGTDGQNHLQIRSKDNRGVPQTRTENDFGDTTRVVEPGTRIGADAKTNTTLSRGTENGANVVLESTTDKRTGAVVHDVKTYPGGDGKENVGNVQATNVQRVERTFDDKTGRFTVAVKTKDGDLTYTTDKSGGDVTPVPPKPDDIKTKSAISPVGDMMTDPPTVDPVLDGKRSDATRVTGALNDGTGLMNPTQYTVTDIKKADGGLQERDIHFDWALLNGAAGNTGLTQLKVDGPGGQKTLTNISDIKYTFNGVGYDATFTSSDGTITKGTTSPDGKKILRWDS